MHNNAFLNGGIRVCSHAKGLYAGAVFEGGFLTEFRRNYRKEERLILEVSDNVLPNASIDRLKVIGEFAGSLASSV